jgi:chromosome segregation ATPase
MNNMIPGENPPAQPEVWQQGDRKKGNGLNFPSVAFMGIAVFLVVLMIVLLGWKIVNLENEKARLDTERRLFERDKSAYAKVLEDLPSLEDKRQNLSRELDELKGKVQSNQTILTSLITQKDAARSDLDKSRATNKQVQEEINATRETLAILQGEILTNRPVLQNLKQNVPALQAEERTLRTERDNLQNQKAKLQNQRAKLQADVSGLEQQKRLFGELSKENGALESLSKRFGTIADGLEASRKGAESAIQGWKTQTQSLSQAYQKEVQNFSKQTQALSIESGNLTNAHKELQSRSQQVLGDFQSATKTLSGGVGQIQKSAGSLDKETQRLSKIVDDSTSNLQGVLSTLSKGIDDLGKAVSDINGHVGSLQAKMASMDGATSKFLETSKEVGNITKDLSTARSGLVNEFAALKELISRLQAVDQALKIIEKRLPQEPAGEKGQ